MPTKSIKFDFFLIKAGNGNQRFWSTLDQALPNTRVITHRGSNLRLCSYSTIGNIRVGSATKIVMNDLPYKTSISEPTLDPLGLQSHEGVTNVTSFALVPDCNVLILHRNQKGVRAGSMLNLLIEHSGVSELGLDIMLDPDIISKLNRMTTIRSLSTRIAYPTDQATYSSLPVKVAAEMSRFYAGRIVKIEIGMGQGDHKEGLDEDKVKSTIGQLLSARRDGIEEIESLVIKGRDVDDEKIQPLDLIRQRLTASVDIEVNGRYLPQDQLEEAVQLAYNEMRGVIERYRPF